MGHYRAWWPALLFLGLACCQQPARLRVVQVGGCYVEKHRKGSEVTGLDKCCFFAVQGWRDTPAQRQQLDSLAATLLAPTAGSGTYESCGVIYYQYSAEINEKTKHNSGDDTSMHTQGDRIAMYDWHKIMRYERYLYEGGGRPLPAATRGEPSVVVDAEGAIKRRVSK